MAEEISKLQQAFTETGAQLDRIIDAYERTQPVSNYPRTMRFTNTSDGTYIEVTINEDLTYTSSYQGGFVIETPSPYLGENYIMVIPLNWTVSGGGCEYNKTTFEIDQSNWNPQATAEWINS